MYLRFSFAFFFPIILLCGFLSLSTIKAKPHKFQVYLEEKIQEIKQKKLGQKHYWWLLLHDQSNKAGFQSEADGQNFFFSKVGHKDPNKEIIATLKAFFNDPASYDRNKHPQCRFPARLAWLKKELQLNPKKMPQIKCPSLNLWLEILDYESISIIFASHYLNAPVSAFGHTLIKINR